VQQRLRRVSGDVEFDCSEVTFIDSCGLHLLIAVGDACRAGGGSLVVVNPSRCLTRLLALSGLTAMLATRVDGSCPR
jgi:anti-anti-sigma factor